MGKYIIGIDVGGTNIRIGAVKNGSEILAFEKVRQTSVLNEAEN